MALDFYCLGVLIFELAAGFPPAFRGNKSPTFKKKIEIKFPSHFSHSLRSLIAKLMEPNPDIRLGTNGGVREVLNHDWFFPVLHEKLFKRSWKTKIRPNVYNFYVDEEIQKKVFNYSDFFNENDEKIHQNDPLWQKFENFDCMFKNEKKTRNLKKIEAKRQTVKEASKMINSPLSRPLAIHQGDSTDGEIAE